MNPTSNVASIQKALAHPQVPEVGRIDIHSHILPGLDDGCRDFQESLRCVDRLRQAGYVGTICTPHIMAEHYVHSIDQIRAKTIWLNRQFGYAGVDYRVWPGAELRIDENVIDRLKATGVPTLAGSKCVLVDFWTHKWPRSLTKVFEWLLGEGYQPILAHPERLSCTSVLDKRLTQLAKMGVWLQGNFRCMTGHEGSTAHEWVRKLLREDRYHFMALDMHRPDSLEKRLIGLELVQAEFSPEALDRFTIDAPRRMIFAGNACRSATP